MSGKEVYHSDFVCFMKLDAHQHFWQFDPVRDAWITDNMQVLRRDFMPEDLQPVLQANQMTGCVAIQADQSETETRFLLGLAARHDFIQAVVGWVDLQSPAVGARLEYWSQFPRLRGFRHILQGEPPEFMLQPAFLNGIKTLGKFDFTYDILVFPKHLSTVRTLVGKFENQRFMLDHIAKPYIRRGLITQWRKDIRALARHPNLWCKVSGLVTEADWQHGRPDQFVPYLDVVFEAFGPERVVYGSDWPVCLLAAAYAAQKDLLDNHLSTFSPTEQQQFWGTNGTSFYSSV